MKSISLLLAAIAFSLSAPAQNSSTWVFFGPDHRLHYGSDERGNRIMDFSHAGYKGGGVALPDVPAARTLGPVPGDNTAAIQTAIDEVSCLEPNADGFRGAVLLSPGTYEVTGTLRISTGGVVLRGSGSGAGGTVVRMTGSPRRLLDISGSGSRQTDGEPAPILDAYIPFGADWFHVPVEDVSRFQPGDSVIVRRPVTEDWVRLMEMNDLVSPDGRPRTWLRPGAASQTDRTIRAISGNRIILDVPLADSFDARYLNPPGASVVKYRFPGRIRQVGLESLRVVAVPAQGSTGYYRALGMNALSDAWVRDVAFEETLDTIVVGSTARRVTFERVRVHHSETAPHMGGSSPADFAISGTQILLDRCGTTGKQSWPVVTQALVTGPNVILNFTADEAGFSAHQRWATGVLVDGGEFRNNKERRAGIAFANRQYAGSGHGWSIGWAVAWNVKSDYLLVEQPPGAMNWSIGSTGRFTTVLWDGTDLPVPCLPSDRIESTGAHVTPSSLYLQQLRERLGQTALDNIGYADYRP